MKTKMILTVLILLGSLNFTEAKKVHHKKFKKALKKTVSHSHKHRLVPSLPIVGTAGPYNQLEL